ncbi:MAG: hypothetical protein FK732_06830 [Asgard group archaeon]|nr:hypothetical protein [Asgard group archaeon]
MFEVTIIKVVLDKEERYGIFLGKVQGIIDNDREIVFVLYLDFSHDEKKIRSDEHICLQINNVENLEFKFTLGKLIEDLIRYGNSRNWSSDFQRGIDVTRWLDPVLTEFKKTPFGEDIYIELQPGKIGKTGGGSVNEEKEVRLKLRHLRTQDESLKTFIHELIHIVQLEIGFSIHDSSIEDEQVMTEIANQYLSGTKIPELWNHLTN